MACSMHGETRSISNLLEKPKGKGPLGSSRRKWEEGSKWSHRPMSEERYLWTVLVITVTNLRGQMAGNSLTSRMAVSFSGRSLKSTRIFSRKETRSVLYFVFLFRLLFLPREPG
jgi:hypothetical protein